MARYLLPKHFAFDAASQIERIPWLDDDVKEALRKKIPVRMDLLPDYDAWVRANADDAQHEIFRAFRDRGEVVPGACLIICETMGFSEDAAWGFPLKSPPSQSSPSCMEFELQVERWVEPEPPSERAPSARKRQELVEDLRPPKKACRATSCTEPQPL